MGVWEFLVKICGILEDFLVEFCADFDASFWRGGRGIGGLKLGFEAELRLR